MLSTRFSDRSHAHVRVVDELPNVIARTLIDGAMEFEPLPPLEEEPKDEQSGEFRRRFAQLELTDERYLEEMAAIESAELSDAEREGRVAQCYRALKDRVRHTLGLPERQTDSRRPNLEAHARAHHINPSYDLPRPAGANKAPRYDDKFIQTLLLPDRLERRCANIIAKGRSWEQEAGIQVLQCAIGFLEWQDAQQSKTALAPLAFLPVEMKERKSAIGQRFRVEGSESSFSGNTVLAFKLKRDYGIELPALGEEDADIEGYLAAVESVKPKTMHQWRVRRFIAIGVFPSISLAMYEDLASEHWRIEPGTLIARTLGGREPTGGTVRFEGEYEVDNPAVEADIPLLVGDADSSQLSALVDVARGRDVALEGPPGTGKSQTIVNVIAAALANGEKVLFVAEKLAALEVVRSRLEEKGLGEFLMPLQAGKADRAQVIESMRHRLDLTRLNVRDAKQLDELIGQFRGERAKLAGYIEVISAAFHDTGLTNQQVLGRAIVAHRTLTEAPSELVRIKLPGVAQLSAVQLERLESDAGDYADLVREQASIANHWSFVRCGYLDPFALEGVIDIVSQALSRHGPAIAARSALETRGLVPLPDSEAMASLRELIDRLAASPLDARSIYLLRDDSNRQALERFDATLQAFAARERLLTALLGLSREHLLANGAGLALQLRVGAEQARSHAIECLSEQALCAPLKRQQALVDRITTQIEVVEALLSGERSLDTVPLSVLYGFAGMLRDTEPAVIERRLGRKVSEVEVRVIKELKVAVEELEMLRTRLEEPFDLNNLQPRTALFAALLALRGKGAFSFLSSGYRRAKRTARSIMRNPKRFDHTRTLGKIAALIDYLDQREALSRDARYRDYYWFAGDETNITRLEEQLALQARIEAIAGEASALEAYGLTAGTAELKGLRERAGRLPVTGPDEQMADLSSRELATHKTGAQKEIESLRSVTDALRALREQLGRDAPIAESALNVKALDKASQAIVELRTLAERIEADDVARSLLGSRYEGTDSEPGALDAERSAEAAMRAFDEPVADLLINSLEAGRLEKLAAEIDSFTGSLGRYTESLAELEEAIGTSIERWGFDPYAPEAGEYLAALAGDREGLDGHARRNALRSELDRWHIEPVLNALDCGDVAPEAFVTVLRALLARNMVATLYAEHGAALQRYRGERLDRHRAELASLDRKIIRFSQRRLRYRLVADAAPPPGRGNGKVSSYTEMVLLRHEAGKQKRFIAPRELTARAGAALRELKPCWMMSPLTVAKYLPRESGLFDLVVIDEASQMRPENAIGAMMRAKRALVVGDTNQLPPTAFFRADDVDDEEEEDATTQESILDMANMTLEARRRLRWHYRSRHGSLIAFSNHHIYDGQLLIFPSARKHDPRMGVAGVKVDGHYHAGVNPEEARVIIEHILEHMVSDPDRSLGVVVMNKKQQELLEEEFRAAHLTSPTAQRFIDVWAERNGGLEQFFIKNLENVQGDERDVMFIGTVYGPDAKSGKVYQRFGPIAGAAGRRRLNVLFSRAKEKSVTFTSMEANDIHAAESGNSGALMLRGWLEYIASGRLDAGICDDREPDSEFEEHVIELIEAMGCQAVPQVGVSGFFIDIGVRHPNYPHGFLLGIECDGASYHSARSARDRDRLREEILAGLGWRLYRIWSTDWFTDPLGEATKLRSAIEKRLTQVIAGFPDARDAHDGAVQTCVRDEAPCDSAPALAASRPRKPAE